MSEQKLGFLGTGKGRLLVIAGVAAVATLGLSTVIDFPPGGSSTSGTIVPAERHRATQNSAADINVGLPGGAQSQPAAGTIPNIPGTGIAAGNAVTANAVSPNAVSPNVLSPNVVSADAKSPNAVSPNALSPNVVSPNGGGMWSGAKANAVSPNAVSPNALSPNVVSPNGGGMWSGAKANAVSPNAVSPNAVSPNARSN